MKSTDIVPTVRNAKHDDLAGIERLLLDAGLPTDGVAEILAASPADFSVVEDDEGTKLVAVAGLEVCCDNALLRSVAVQPEWRSRGVAQALIRRIVCEAESRSLRALYLLTMTAEHYFPRFGFERVAREAVPQEIAETLEFKSACPASAVAMVKTFAEPGVGG